MFSEILKIIPKLDAKDLNAMEKALSTRFKKVAKGFGQGLASVIKGGGIAGIGLALIDKVLNPLKEVQDAISKSLKGNDDVATYAAQFDTTAGNLAKILALGKATGLEAENMYKLIEKFQGTVTAYRANPKDPANSSVANFANNPDTAAAFFDFIQSLQKATKDQQIQIQTQVFGEKQILKMSDFLQADFKALYAQVGLDKVSSNRLSAAIERLAGFNDTADINDARRELADTMIKGGGEGYEGVIRGSMITSDNLSKNIAMGRENANISRYNNLAAISNTMDKMMMKLEEGIGYLGKFIADVTPKVERFMEQADSFLKTSRYFGFGGSKGKGE